MDRANEVTTPAQDAPRRLSGLEKGIFRGSDGARLNFTMILRLRGSLSSDSLRTALGAVQKRHPLLRRAIRFDGHDAQFVACDRPIPVRNTEEPELKKEVERELNEHIDWATGPLARVVHRSRDEVHDLLLSFHHSIGDGMSGVYFARDLVRAAGEPQTRFEALADVDCQAQLSSDAYASKREMGLRSLLSRELMHDWTIGKGLPLRIDQPTPACEQKLTVRMFEIEPELASRIAARARAENTTVHGALAAAMLRSIVADFATDCAISVSLGSAVNIRDVLTPSAQEGIGLFAGLVFFRARLARDADFWLLAREVRRQIQLDCAAGHHWVSLFAQNLALKSLGAEYLSNDELCERFAAAFPISGVLSNLGRLAIETRFGNLSIEALHFAGASSTLCMVVATVTSLHGRIFWNVTLPVPLISTKRVDVLVERIYEDLAKAGDGIPSGG